MPPDSTAMAEHGPAEPRFAAVQLAALGDSGAAAALRDSLARAGWTAYLRGTRAGDRPAWAVRVGPSRNLAYVELLAAALRRERGDGGMRAAVVVHDSGSQESQGVAGFSRVSYGTHGMRARARWLLAPDGRTLLAREDPEGVERTPLPSGFFFASEIGLRSAQVDSVWDVAPAPDWRLAAYGRAWPLPSPAAAASADSAAEPADTNPADALDSTERPPPLTVAALAESLGVTPAALLRAAVATSGMGPRLAVAQPGVVTLDTAAADRLGTRILYPALGGWRVRWSAAGSALFIARAPARGGAHAAGWLRLDLANGTTQPVALPTDATAPAWVDGPVLEAGMPLDTTARRIPIDGGAAFESGGGWIRLRGHRLAPGVALAATRGGRFLLALAPNPAAGRGEPAQMLVVYVLGPGPIP